MLKAAIIYLQGSSGNLLLRTLTLSKKTIPLTRLGQDDNLTPTQRLDVYNNWSADDWTKSETEISYWYSEGYEDFVKYELDPRWFIDNFHPNQFCYENERQLLWLGQGWQYLIYIDYDDSDIPEITQLAELKRKDLAHKTQIKTEHETLARMKHQLPGLSVHWKTFKDLNSYLSSIKYLDAKLNLSLDYDLVTDLWTKWNNSTNAITKQ